jgi:hypothetical protein
MAIAQLSLFDTAAVIKPAYQVGDRVKIRKRPIAATYLKKDDIIEVSAVHPINGSIKFWNERSERWEFIHPDEIGSIFKSESATDSPTPAEMAVGESSCRHSGTDTIPSVDAAIQSNCLPSKIDPPTPAEVAVGESKALSGDSPTPAEVAVGESKALSGDSPTPAEVAVGESKALSGDSPTPAEVAVGESKKLSGETDCFVLDPISVYRPRGTARGGEYYRLSYKEGGKVRQVHIRGGNIALRANVFDSF